MLPLKILSMKKMVRLISDNSYGPFIGYSVTIIKSELLMNYVNLPSIDNLEILCEFSSIQVENSYINDNNCDYPTCQIVGVNKTCGLVEIAENSSENDLENSNEKSNSKNNLIVIILSVIGGFFGLSIIVFLIFAVKTRCFGINKNNKISDVETESKPNKNEKKSNKNEIVNQSISQATGNFMLRDCVIIEKIGGGSFGEVYKGILQGTTEVALKKLIKEQVDEFINEASILAYVRNTSY